METKLNAEVLSRLSEDATRRFSWTPRHTNQSGNNDGELRSRREQMLSKNGLEWLAHSAEYPFLSTTERSKQLGLSGSKAQKAKVELEHFGYIKQHKVYKGRRGGYLVLQEVTNEGYSYLAKVNVHCRPPRGIGSWLHRYYQWVVAAWAKHEYRQSRVEIEDAGSGKSVDVAVYLPSQQDGEGVRIAYEILVAGESKELINVVKDLEAGFSGVVLCTDSVEKIESLRERISKEFGGRIPPSVEFRLISEFMDRSHRSGNGDELGIGGGKEVITSKGIGRNERIEKTASPLESEARKNSLETGHKGRRGRKPKISLIDQVGDAYGHLHDLDVLQESKLVNLDEVRKRIQPQRTMPEAQGLRDLLLDCARQVIKDLDGMPNKMGVKLFLEKYIKGENVVQIAQALGVSREWCSRYFRREAIRLASMRFVRLYL